MRNKIFPAFVAGIYIVWLYLVITTTGFGVYLTHWLYSVMMIVGAAVAGFTPVGGGAVAYPVLSLYADLTPQIARDFSLAIQAVGMTSASIYIMTRKPYRLKFYAPIPLYVAFNFIGFIGVTAFYSYIPVHIIQMIFVTLAVAFVGSFMITKQYGTLRTVAPKWYHIGLFSFAGGACAALFGTGSDMMIYIMLSVYYGMREERATDVSIVTMAAVSVLGVLYTAPSMSPEVYPMWLVAAPVVAVFAPFGNMLLTIIRKYYMLLFVLGLSTFNYIYWGAKNPTLLLPSIAFIITFTAIFTFQRYGLEGTLSRQESNPIGTVRETNT